MSIKLKANINNPPISGLATAHLINGTVPVEIVWSKEETSVQFPDNRLLVCHSNNDVLRALARSAPDYKLYGETAIERTQIDHWLSFSLTCEDDISWAMSFLDKSIAPVTYLVANKLTIADFALFNEMHSRYEFLVAKGIPQHVQRWYDLITAQPLIQKVLQSLPEEARSSAKRVKRSPNASKEQTPAKTVERKQEGKFVDLPGAEMGKVIVRFPPEASGYLHIGHAKAALLNQYYALAFQGTLIMRFDDTNPAKETVEFENVILGDLELLQIKPDVFTHTSNYFDLMLDYCVQLLKESKAYVDDTPPEQMKLEREQRVESANRSNSVEKNLSLWQEMIKGSEAGQKCCVRAKIDMSSPNGCMRDPTIYRCKNEPHPRTGTKYKVYPTYDFACPIVDAIENVTHTLRTMEYHDRDDQFYWFIDALKLRKPYIWEYSRLNMTNTVLSKRKLTWFVDSGLVDGWDDPRFPTVRGILRRGMTVEGLREFIIAQGSSKSVVFMNWDKIWAFNKKVIDPIAPRYTALEQDKRVIVNVAGAKLEHIQVPVHPKDEALGKKTVTLGPRVYIDYADAEALKEGENATFINWGNLLIKKVNKDGSGIITSVDAALNLDNKDFKKTLKLTWLAVESDPSAYPPTFCVYFDNIISKAVLGKDEDFKQFIGHKTRDEVAMLGDPELKKCKKGDIIQLQRRGFFKVDNAYAPPSPYSGVPSPIILFSIPDGHTKDVPTSGLKINAVDAKSTKKSYSPAATTAPAGAANEKAAELDKLIGQQGDLVRELKTKKAPKEQVDVEVKKLLGLKADYKAATGKDWKPGQTTAPAAATNDAGSVNAGIVKQGELVRDLKSKKATKPEIDAAVKVLLELKAQYKSITGQDWKPGTVAPAAAAPTSQVQGSNRHRFPRGRTWRRWSYEKGTQGAATEAGQACQEAASGGCIGGRCQKADALGPGGHQGGESARLVLAGDHQGRDDRVLRCVRVLHPAPLVLCHLEVHQAVVRCRDHSHGRQGVLLPHLRVQGGAREGEDAHRGLCPRSGMGHEIGRLRAGRTHCRASHIRDCDVSRLCQVDTVLQRSAHPPQSVEQCCALGVQASATILAHPRVPLAGGPHGLRRQGGGRQRGARHSRSVCSGLHASAGHTRGEGPQDREGEVRWR
ncbi:bifunctional glutamate/proline--tRNA ligase isoform X2 [Drosophila guanche]|uniref:bifunctional glutamate/proline--tRNA ligase isoform X2 n=1 Tax=Drosophila guanche TaxID=7266 RepID=UPI001470C0D9|nr:bifunctional glutamate/proline--tRNA ligase isoform X2 [Drosophila guanche]